MLQVVRRCWLNIYLDERLIIADLEYPARFLHVILVGGGTRIVEQYLVEV